MNSAIKPISNQAFLTQFENQTLDRAYFNHLGHLRLAWLYLQVDDLETVVNKVCTGIKAYAISLGAKQKFNLTITDAIVRIMAQRIDAMPHKSWPLFLERNTDLIEDALSVLTLYFSKERLLSEEARISLLAPDLKNI
jgi:hypothetical protein